MPEVADIFALPPPPLPPATTTRIPAPFPPPPPTPPPPSPPPLANIANYTSVPSPPPERKSPPPALPSPPLPPFPPPPPLAPASDITVGGGFSSLFILFGLMTHRHRRNPFCHMCIHFSKLIVYRQCNLCIASPHFGGVRGVSCWACFPRPLPGNHVHILRRWNSGADHRRRMPGVRLRILSHQRSRPVRV